MAAEPRKPNLAPTAAYNPANLTPGRVIDNPPTSSLAKALAPNKAQVAATK